LLYAVLMVGSPTGTKNMYYGVSGVLKAIKGVRTSSSLVYCKIRL